jgi:hypothetical protein
MGDLCQASGQTIGKGSASSRATECVGHAAVLGRGTLATSRRLDAPWPKTEARPSSLAQMGRMPEKTKTLPPGRTKAFFVAGSSTTKT